MRKGYDDAEFSSEDVASSNRQEEIIRLILTELSPIRSLNHLGLLLLIKEVRRFKT